MQPIRKVVRVVSGFLLIIVGLILAIPGVPGPGIAVVVLGLIILSDHFEWARRMLAWAKKKAEAIRDRVRK